MIGKVAGLESLIVSPNISSKFSELEEKMQQQSLELQELRSIVNKEWDRPAINRQHCGSGWKCLETDDNSLRWHAQTTITWEIVYKMLSVKKIQEDNEELGNIRRRSNDIIIHGLQEKTEKMLMLGIKMRRTNWWTCCMLFTVTMFLFKAQQDWKRVIVLQHWGQLKLHWHQNNRGRRSCHMQKLVWQQDLRESVYTARPYHQAEDEKSELQLWNNWDIGESMEKRIWWSSATG